MAPLYTAVCESLGWTSDAAALASMEASNAAELAKLDATIAECNENEGETEVREAYLAKAQFYVRIGENAKTHAALEETYSKTVAVGLRLDLLLTKLRVGFFFDDLKEVKKTIDRAKALLETGGDWERRNRLKVYEALFLLMVRARHLTLPGCTPTCACRRARAPVYYGSCSGLPPPAALTRTRPAPLALQVRDFKKSSTLFLDAIATFTATELLPYNQFILYAVAASVVALPRADLKTKVIDAPEILQVIDEIPHLGGLVNGLYSCQYRTLMRSLVDIMETLKADRHFAPHVRYYWREVRVLAYTQFLESYRSVSLASMAATFGFQAPFLDQELSGFIAGGRLSCSIDKVGAIVSSTRPDTKNAQYQATIKQGDLLLNKVQKLSRVVNL